MFGHLAPRVSDPAHRMIIGAPSADRFGAEPSAALMANPALVSFQMLYASPFAGEGDEQHPLNR